MKILEKQFSKKEAVKFHDSKTWQGMSDELIGKIYFFQQRTSIPDQVSREAIGRVLGRHIWAQEFFVDDSDLKKEFLGKVNSK